MDEKIEITSSQVPYEIFIPKGCNLNRVNKVVIRGEEFLLARHGKWIKEWNIYFQDYVYFCSSCHHRFCIEYNYCPNCGAKMSRERIDND